MPDFKIALSDVAAFSLSLRMISTPRLRRIFWAEKRQRLGHFRQNSLARLNQHAAMLFVAQAKVVFLHGVDEIVQLGHHFNARESAAADDKRQQLAAQFRVLLNVRFFEHVDQMIAQHHGIRERPKRHGVFQHSGHAVESW